MAYEKDNESAERLLDGNSASDEIEWKPQKQRRSWTWPILNVLLFITSLALFSVRLFDGWGLSETELMRRTSQYSPVFEMGIDLKTVVKETEGGLFETKNTPSQWRNALKPDEAVDAAWEELEIIRVFPITEAQLRKLGKDPEYSVKFPPQYGLGDNAYMAQIDMFHQIHCLNLLRHLAWVEYERNGTAKKPYSGLHWIHVSHCVDILMQNLMCTGNLDIITFNWQDTQTNPVPDFAVNHKCRDYDAIFEWQDKHSVPKDWGRNVTPPADAKRIPISDEYFKYFGPEAEDQPQVGDHSNHDHHVD